MNNARHPLKFKMTRAFTVTPFFIVTWMGYHGRRCWSAGFPTTLRRIYKTGSCFLRLILFVNVDVLAVASFDGILRSKPLSLPFARVAAAEGAGVQPHRLPAGDRLHAGHADAAGVRHLPSDDPLLQRRLRKVGGGGLPRHDSETKGCKIRRRSKEASKYVYT